MYQQENEDVNRGEIFCTGEIATRHHIQVLYGNIFKRFSKPKKGEVKQELFDSVKPAL